jgi:MOB kinase activator 1
MKEATKNTYKANIRPIKEGNKGFHLKQIAQMTLGSGNMSLAVELPTGTSFFTQDRILTNG